MSAAGRELQELLDRRRIHDLVLGYCRGIDRRDFEAVRDCYHPEGVDNHTGFSGTRDEFVAWVSEVLARFEGTMHLVGNHLAEVDGDSARAETYGLAFHWGTPPDDPQLNFVSAFRYLDTLERRDGEWRIRERHVVREWARVLGAADWLAKESVGH